MKTLFLYSKTTVKKPLKSPEAASAKQTSSVKQLNPAICTKLSAVQQLKLFYHDQFPNIYRQNCMYHYQACVLVSTNQKPELVQR